MKKSARSVGMTLGAVAMLTFWGNYDQTGFAATSEPQKVSTLTYHDEWRKLWEDHITWTRVVIMGVLDALPGTPEYTARLLQNPGDMAAALQPYYGISATELGDLIKQHLVIAAQVLVDAKAGDTTALNTDVSRWYANGHDIAVKMGAMNPKYWPLSMGDPMWKQHLDVTLAEATDHLMANYSGEVAAYDQVHDLALQMADFFSNGVLQQFRGAFSGPKNESRHN